MAKNMRDKLKEQSEELEKRIHESGNRVYENFGTVFKKDAIPKGVSFWLPDAGKEHVIDIIPFFASKSHPTDKAGLISYNVPYWSHRKIGSMNDSFVCPTKTFRLPCPICEEIQAHYPHPKWNDLKPTQRNSYLVWVHDSKEDEEKGIQIWECSWYFFEKHLDRIAKMSSTGGYIRFADIEKGKRIIFEIEKQGKDSKKISYVGHHFEDRPEAIPDSIVDEIFCLDEVINLRPTYEDISASFVGEEEDIPQPEANTSYTVNDKEDDIPDSVFDNVGDCPHGGEFGVSVDEPLAECESCKKFNACVAESDRNNSKSEPDDHMPEERPEPAPTETVRRRRR